MLEKKIIAALKNHKLTMKEMITRFGKDENLLTKIINKFYAEGIAVDTTRKKNSKQLFYSIKILPQTGNIHYISGKDKKHRHMKFGVVSDLHFASKFHLPKTFHETMLMLEDAGVQRVYVAGDVVDGVNIYRGHLENLLAFSVEDQADIAAEALSKHPKLEFWGIAGNHDYSFTKQNGVKPLAIIEAKCDNFKNLGDLRADVIYHGINNRLIHGAGGRAYAISYPTQTYLRDYFKGLDREDMKDIPHIMLVGHYHTLYQGKDHGIHILQAGSFQDGDNEFCLRRGLTGPNGAFIVDVDYHGGVIDRFKTEYVEPTIRKKEKGKAFTKTTVNY